MSRPELQKRAMATKLIWSETAMRSRATQRVGNGEGAGAVPGSGAAAGRPRERGARAGAKAEALARVLSRRAPRTGAWVYGGNQDLGRLRLPSHCCHPLRVCGLSPRPRKASVASSMPLNMEERSSVAWSQHRRCMGPTSRTSAALVRLNRCMYSMHISCLLSSHRPFAPDVHINGVLKPILRMRSAVLKHCNFSCTANRVCVTTDSGNDCGSVDGSCV
mmetsp:Transcript_29320/g.62351  ORF Transcript_29320/g.62351 Transcript_29320/m.62351 type:complete len:219 (+) Transcript_29320:138-794(+)